ncbi:hypothetical protein INT47_003797 [Mucor saturninus]|uniref:Uncharacterized protein n=1 Tax=Mucor saturninus TaxID=64648 RepID=A0A8H7R8K5_9FUNG|nr:hypothetical protein INT47_003797 [Mucor saturninus]
MAKSLTLRAQETLACRPMTTKKAYVSKTNEFIKWANETSMDENELERSIVSGTKLSYFLRDQVKKNIAIDRLPHQSIYKGLFNYRYWAATLARKGTLADSYTSLDQVSKVVQFYLDGQRNHGENLRDALVFFLFPHYFWLRGESIRNAELTDFQTINLNSENAQPNIKRPALVVILGQGKTNKNNRLELTGCIRSTQVEIYPILIFGLYLF